ncbi:MAG: hypothetical protein P8I83_03840 [Paracoccaceae bacterium]|nr:hypothetical protein [Paracoccaceae bacterium]
MMSKEHEKLGQKTVQSRDDRLKTALKSNMAKRKAQARRKSELKVQNTTSDEAVDTSKD